MNDDLITKGLKNMIGGAATAGGVGQLLQYLERLDGRLAHLEKTFTGAIGSWDQNRIRDVQFNTFTRPHDWPDIVQVASWTDVPTGAPGAFPIVPRGRVRVLAVTLAANFGHSGAVTNMQIRWQTTGGAPPLASLSVSGVCPFASIVFPEPFPSSTANPARAEALDRRTIEYELYGAGANISTIQVYYIDRTD